MRVLDGGLATSLAGHGLPPFTPVEPWVFERPDAVLAVQRAFVDAGAHTLLTPTFRALPSESASWERSIRAGVALTRAAGSQEVWLTLGPGSGHGRAARAARVEGIVLETFVDPGAAMTALQEVLPLGLPTVVSLVPTAALEPAHILLLVDAGAVGIGFNCVDGRTILDAATSVPDSVPLWIKPQGGPLQAEAWDGLASRARWMGGCCGTTPDAIRTLSDRWVDRT